VVLPPGRRDDLLLNLPPTLKQAIQRWLWPLMPGWPDEGRRIVQGPHLRGFLERATQESGCFRRVFNAGSGEGGYSPLLLKLPGVESVIESDLAYRSNRPRRIDPKQAFFGGSLTSIPLADKTMDLVLCTEVLEHIQEHEQALDEIARVMAPRGWLLIAVPTPPAIQDSAHVREGYHCQELVALLNRRGFDVIETRFCMYFFFRFLLTNWSTLPWCPRLLIRGLAILDKLFPWGPPMDLMILARLADAREVPMRNQGAAFPSG
jgi:SAM-dependent methyltransferase